MAVYRYLHDQLERRAAEGRPIQIAVMGSGWYGGGFIAESFRFPGVEVAVVLTRDPDGAVKLLEEGRGSDGVVRAESATELKAAREGGKAVVTTCNELIDELEGVDVFFDATGHLDAGIDAALRIIAKGIHFTTVSAEMDATVGPILAKIAAERGVIYSNVDGDQPGCLARLAGEVRAMGVEVVLVGNGKGFLNCYATPDSILEFVPPGGSPVKIASFTDGSKQSLEMAVVANGLAVVPDVRGMHGVKADKQDLVERMMGAVSREGVVDYAMGETTNLGMTIFVIGKRTDERAQGALSYLRMGDGPYYLFFRDYHLCYFETMRTIVEVVLLGQPTISPRAWAADVLTVAKRDLKAGEILDGIGGFTCYGLIDQAAVVKKENLLPLGLAEAVSTTCDIPKDTPITYDMVARPEDSIVWDLRERLEREMSPMAGR